jgi:hypothetical protein
LIWLVSVGRLMSCHPQVKEQLCYVSNDLIKDMQPVKGLTRGAKSNVMKDIMGGKLKKSFVLPDFHSITKGFVKADDDPVTSNEQVRISV